MNGCGIADGGDLYCRSAQKITGTPTPSVGIQENDPTCSGHVVGNPVTNAPAPTDPLAGLAAPPNPGGCSAGVAATLAPGCYTGITVGNNSTVTLSAGTCYSPVP